MSSPENDFSLDVPVTTEEARMLEAAGFKTSSPLKPSQISEDLRKEIIRTVSAGDEKKGGAFTVPVAAHLEKLIHAAKIILMAEKISNNDIGALLHKKSMNSMGGTSMGFMTSPAYVGMSDDDDDSSYAPLAGNGGKSTENFGVQAIKELIGAAKTMHDSPAKDVEALAVARREGLVDVAAALEAKLGIHKKDEATT
jgi:hypothetical protein